MSPEPRGPRLGLDASGPWPCGPGTGPRTTLPGVHLRAHMCFFFMLDGHAFHQGGGRASSPGPRASGPGFRASGLRPQAVGPKPPVLGPKARAPRPKPCGPRLKPRPGTLGLKHLARDPSPAPRAPGPGPRAPGIEPRSPPFRSRHLGPGPRAPSPGPRDPGPGPWAPGHAWMAIDWSGAEAASRRMHCSRTSFAKLDIGRRTTAGDTDESKGKTGKTAGETKTADVSHDWGPGSTKTIRTNNN